MIHANELRIGNWFHPTSYGNWVRIPITNFFHKVTAINCFGEIEECLPERIETKVFSCKEIEPIPLTPEILEKAGFEQVGMPGYYSLSVGEKFYVSFTTSGFWLCIERFEEEDGEDEYCRQLKIESVHQLQNLIHALTGTELTINI